MSRLKIERLAASMAAAAILVAAVAVQPARAQGHGHDAAAPARLSLDHGRKWATDGALRDGMGRIRALVEPKLPAGQAGQLTPANYAALAGQVDTEVAGIVANCKLEPKADAVLHVVIGEIGAGTDVMAGRSAGQRPAQGLTQVAKAVNDYAAHFEHPGFQPLRNVHR
jgi:hypothetical protein